MMMNASELLTDARTTVVRAYSGRPGCGCGCRGTYQEKGRIVSDNLRILRENVDRVAVTLLDDGLICLSFETEERYRWLYVRTEA